MAALAGSISRRYARALFSIGASTATDGNFPSSSARSLEDVAAMWSGSAELRDALANRGFQGVGEARRAAEPSCRASRPTADVQKFVLLLLARRRLAGRAAASRARTARWRTSTRAACARA